jgi:hypothetical protein
VELKRTLTPSRLGARRIKLSSVRCRNNAYEKVLAWLDEHHSDFARGACESSFG